LSIIVPIYNVEKYLRECLESVLCQTYRDWEAICINDGSTDGSLALVQKLTEGDARFRIIRHEKNQSVLMARKNGLREACGKYVHFVDRIFRILQDHVLNVVCI
jgi:glycosyltransferase involved in cell wall biosynthesis